MWGFHRPVYWNQFRNLAEDHRTIETRTIDELPKNRAHRLAIGSSCRLCCTNPVRDSSRESSVVAGMHEQTRTPDLQDQELAGLQ